MDLILFGSKLPERHVYLATQGRQYSLKDIKRIFGSWNAYVTEFDKQVEARMKQDTIKTVVATPVTKPAAKVVTNVIPKQTT